MTSGDFYHLYILDLFRITSQHIARSVLITYFTRLINGSTPTPCMSNILRSREIMVNLIITFYRSVLSQGRVTFGRFGFNYEMQSMMVPIRALDSNGFAKKSNIKIYYFNFLYLIYTL